MPHIKNQGEREIEYNGHVLRPHVWPGRWYHVQITGPEGEKTTEARTRGRAIRKAKAWVDEQG